MWTAPLWSTAHLYTVKILKYLAKVHYVAQNMFSMSWQINWEACSFRPSGSEQEVRATAWEDERRGFIYKKEIYAWT